MPHTRTPVMSSAARRRVISALLLICLGYFWIFNLSALPFSVQAVKDAGCGQGLLDTRLHYDAAAVSQAFTCYSSSGRTMYRDFLLLDASFALCYGFGFSLLLMRWLVMLSARNNRWRVVALLPLAVAGFDLLENGSLLYLLAIYPAAVPGLATLAGLFTSIKWLLGATSLLALVACCALALWRRGR